MSVPATTFFHLEKLRRYDGPVFFLGGGFLAGMLLFVAWLSAQPDGGKHALRARGNGVVGANGMETPGGGVLDDITGDLRAGARSDSGGEQRDDNYFYSENETDAEVDGEVDGALAADERFEDGYTQDADAMVVGEAPIAEGALTDSLLDPPAAPVAAPSVDTTGSAPGAALSSWYVEVEVAPGQVQMLQLNAESPEHALAILRDFRGDPRVLRGPSPEPLP